MTTRVSLDFGSRIVPTLVERTGHKHNNKKGKGGLWTLASFKATSGFTAADYQDSGRAFVKASMDPKVFGKAMQQQKNYRVAHTVIHTPHWLTHETQRMPPCQRDRSRCHALFDAYFVMFCE